MKNIDGKLNENDSGLHVVIDSTFFHYIKFGMSPIVAYPKYLEFFSEDQTHYNPMGGGRGKAPKWHIC